MFNTNDYRKRTHIIIAIALLCYYSILKCVYIIFYIFLGYNVGWFCCGYFVPCIYIGHYSFLHTWQSKNIYFLFLQFITFFLDYCIEILEILSSALLSTFPSWVHIFSINIIILWLFLTTTKNIKDRLFDDEYERNKPEEMYNSQEKNLSTFTHSEV